MEEVLNRCFWIYQLNLAAWQRTVVGSVKHRLKQWVLTIGMLRVKTKFWFGSVGLWGLANPLSDFLHWLRGREKMHIVELDLVIRKL